jgi:hypothetical protein
MKTLFTFYVDNAIDLITNSSSELFVFVGDTKRKLINLIKKIHPTYREEYATLKGIEELTDDELDTYISRHYHCWSNEEQRQIENLVPGFTRDEMYVDKTMTYKDYNGNYPVHTYVVDITDANRKKFWDGIDPERKMYFLFSTMENPNWEMQEALWRIGERYHLG